MTTSSSKYIPKKCMEQYLYCFKTSYDVTNKIRQANEKEEYAVYKVGKTTQFLETRLGQHKKDHEKYYTEEKFSKKVIDCHTLEKDLLDRLKSNCNIIKRSEIGYGIDKKTKKLEYFEANYNNDIKPILEELTSEEYQNNNAMGMNRDFVCNFPNCGRIFNSIGGLNLHKSKNKPSHWLETDENYEEHIKRTIKIEKKTILPREKKLRKIKESGEEIYNSSYSPSSSSSLSSSSLSSQSPSNKRISNRIMQKTTKKTGSETQIPVTPISKKAITTRSSTISTSRSHATSINEKKIKTPKNISPFKKNEKRKRSSDSPNIIKKRAKKSYYNIIRQPIKLSPQRFESNAERYNYGNYINKRELSDDFIKKIKNLNIHSV